MEIFYAFCWIVLYACALLGLWCFIVGCTYSFQQMFKDWFTTR